MDFPGIGLFFFLLLKRDTHRQYKWLSIGTALAHQFLQPPVSQQRNGWEGSPAVELSVLCLLICLWTVLQGLQGPNQTGHWETEPTFPSAPQNRLGSTSNLFPLYNCLFIYMVHAFFFSNWIDGSNSDQFLILYLWYWWIKQDFRCLSNQSRWQIKT